MTDNFEVAPASSGDEAVIGEKGIPAAIISSQLCDDLHAGFGSTGRVCFKKLDLKSLPAVTPLYLSSFLDCNNGIYNTSLPRQSCWP